MLRWSEINWRTSDKTCLCLVILTNESSINQDLDYTIDWVNLEYNIFLNKLVRMRFVLTIYNIHFCLALLYSYVHFIGTHPPKSWCNKEWCKRMSIRKKVMIFFFFFGNLIIFVLNKSYFPSMITIFLNLFLCHS